MTDVLWTSGGTDDDLVTSQKVYLNKRLATLYPGATFSGRRPRSNTTFVAGTWPASQGRSGMLTQPGFLWSASDPAKTSIVKRGKLIHDDVVCQDVLPPPIDLGDAVGDERHRLQVARRDDALSTCDSEILQSDARMMYAPCKTCHAHMDPYSRVLQNFGPIGNYRTMDEANRAINASVTFTAAAAGAHDGGRARRRSASCSRRAGDQGLLGPEDGQLRARQHDPDVQHLRGERPRGRKTDGTIGSLFKQVAMANILRARKGGAK